MGYYYSFDGTGDVAIDKVLDAVEMAGKAYHHTNEWTDTVESDYGHGANKSPVEWIQNAAVEAAAEMAKLRTERDAHKANVIELEDRVAELEAALRTVRGQVDTMLRVNDELTAQHAELTAEREDLLARAKRSVAIADERSCENVQLRADLATAQKQVRDLAATIEGAFGDGVEESEAGHG